jgi:hypothetical protein
MPPRENEPSIPSVFPMLDEKVLAVLLDGLLDLQRTSPLKCSGQGCDDAYVE